MKHKIFLFLVLVGLMFFCYSTLYGTSTIMSWMKDMYNQVSIKPQEAGSMQEFPTGIVSVDGRDYEEPVAPMSWARDELDEETATQNPIARDAASLANGKLMYNTYCATCHGENGMAGTEVSKKGMPAPPIKAMTPGFMDGYIYKKIKYGGPNMPPLGYATSEQERWNIVNYIREDLEKRP